jgi:D-amino-acid dehydrogenase
VALRREGTGWACRSESGRTGRVASVVVALGPWSKAVLEAQLGLRVPMAFERGYHMQYSGAGRLGRPLYDVDGGYVLGAMGSGLRLTTGVELNDQEAPPDLTQLTLAEKAAREAFPLGERQLATPWMGCRPTLPDSRPAIGHCPGHPGLWLAFGHQHIGVSTGPGTAALLGALMDGEPGPVPAAPFRPQRCIG